MPKNFGYVVEGLLAGMERPGSAGKLRGDFEFLYEQGIRAVVSLTEAPLEKALIEEFGFRYLHLPVPDFDPPHLDQIRKFFVLLDEIEKEGHGVVVHCGAGWGRTGTLLACALVKRGSSARRAITQIRELRPGSIETVRQERMVMDLEAELRRER